MRYVLLAMILVLAGCDYFDDGGDWTVTVSSSPSANPVYIGHEVSFSASYGATGTAVSDASSRWSVQSGPGSYVLNGNGTVATGAFYSPGTYVIIFALTFTADDGTVNTQTSQIALDVVAAPPG